MLNTDPNRRPNINEILFHLENISHTKAIQLTETLGFLRKTEQLLHNVPDSGVNDPQVQSAKAHNVNEPNDTKHQLNNSGNWMGNAANMFKGTSFLKTIKDASTKVIDSVQNSMQRTDVDLTYITSRLLVMSCPTEGIESAAFGNNIDLIKEAIESKHGRNYRIYNLANRTYKKEKFSQVIDLGMQLSAVRAPSLALMCKLSANACKFLNENDKNVCIINCNDGKAISAIAVCTMLMYFKVIRNVDSCLNLFHVKRGAFQLTPCQYKYLRDTQKLFSSSRNELPVPFRPSSNECLMLNIVLVGVPLFNRARNGCTPFVEVFNREKNLHKHPRIRSIKKIHF